MSDGGGATRWRKLFCNNMEVKLEIPRDTLLEVELVNELKGEVGVEKG